jgi:hypothetical protein
MNQFMLNLKKQQNKERKIYSNQTKVSSKDRSEFSKEI